MKPLRLEFCGINSFSEKAVIDFESLTKNGIFGIFGDTGSGKSTILDSINFALYGDVDRSKEKTDIINYRCDGLEIKFTFEVMFEGERKTYTVERILKKNKSGTHKASLRDDTKNITIADNATSVKNKIISIIGLEAEDFRKCIALPQGEFAQFVKSQTGDRIKLIERLFSLSKYGIRLKEKLSIKEKAVDEVYNELLGKLSVFSDVDVELLDSTLLDINNTKSAISQINYKLDYANKQFESVKSLFDSRCELLNIQKKLEEAKSRKEEIDFLRKSLSLLDGAKNVVNFDVQLNEKLSLIYNLNLELLSCENEKLAVQNLLNALVEKIKQADLDNNIEKSLLLLGKYEAISNLPIKLNGVKSKLYELRKLFTEVKNRLQNLIDERILLYNKLETFNKDLNLFDNLDIEAFVKTKFKDFILKEEYIKQINIFADLRSDIKTFEENSELYIYVKKRFDELIKLYEQKIFDAKDVSSVKIYEQLNNLKENLDKKDKLSLKISEIKSRISRLDADILNAESELNRIKTEGEEIALEKADIQFRLKESFGKDYSDYSAVIEEEKQNYKNLVKQKEILLNQKVDLELKIKNLDIKISSLSAQKKANEQESSKIKDFLYAEINKYNFNSVDDCKKLISNFEKSYDNAKDSIASFDKNLLVLENREKELLNLNDIEKVSENDVISSSNVKRQLEIELKNANSQLAVLQTHYNDFVARFNIKKQLEKQFEKLNSERNVIYQLKDLISKNKFLEFIANEYLYEISSLASITLLKLTCGRYFLTYKDNFYVGDNYDCGNLRGVNTLSGGETFLVSLSLALALSSTICAKSLKSFEFFFLDEGFGTLDETVIDTVMDALEKLKSEEFTIGIISHVEELKHRINSKITVNKATESHGSTVHISC